jgi:hypothetical protein
MVSGSRSMLVVGRVDGRIRSSRQYGMATSAELMAFSNPFRYYLVYSVRESTIAGHQQWTRYMKDQQAPAQK